MVPASQLVPRQEPHSWWRSARPWELQVDRLPSVHELVPPSAGRPCAGKGALCRGDPLIGGREGGEGDVGAKAREPASPSEGD